MDVAPEGLVPRLLASEMAYTDARAAVIGRWPGNPFGVATRRDGPVFACRVKGVPSPWLNRVIGLGEPTSARVPELVAWFAEAGIAGRFEVTPDLAGPAIARALAGAGMVPGDGDALVWGRARGGTMPGAVQVVADAATHELFLDTHLAGLELPEAIRPAVKGNLRGWLGLPGWHLLLARRDGVAAGSCVLFVHDGIAYVADMATRPEHRGHGIQAAMLAACHARAAGADVVWARCRFLSQSHRNLQRGGLRTLCTTAFWQ